jgi:hypothetical protein
MGIRGRYRLAIVMVALVSTAISATPVLGVTGWTGPEPAGALGECSRVAAAIDANGAYHVAAQCQQEIRYSSNASGSWSMRAFTHARDTRELEPQIAIDENRVYVAWWREDYSTCGPSPIGVVYRSRSLAGSRWSAEIRLGASRDRLQSFRVVDGIIHATIANEGGVIYERLAGGVLKRYPLPGAIGSSSLRISNAGTARIAYQSINGLSYARFDGTAIKSARIPGTSSGDRDPVLVLDAQDHAHVAWTRTVGPSCGDESPRAPGTYYATNRDGAWTAAIERRITSALGVTSLTVDTATGRAHLIVGDETGIRYFTKSAFGAWKGTRLSTEETQDAVIRLDQDSGVLLVVYTGAPNGIVRYLTKP